MFTPSIVASTSSTRSLALPHPLSPRQDALHNCPLRYYTRATASQRLPGNSESVQILPQIPRVQDWFVIARRNYGWFWASSLHVNRIM